MRGRPMIASIADLARLWIENSALVAKDAAHARASIAKVDRSNDFGESLRNILKSAL